MPPGPTDQSGGKCLGEPHRCAGEVQRGSEHRVPGVRGGTGMPCFLVTEADQYSSEASLCACMCVRGEGVEYVCAPAHITHVRAGVPGRMMCVSVSVCVSSDARVCHGYIHASLWVYICVQVCVCVMCSCTCVWYRDGYIETLA